MLEVKQKTIRVAEAKDGFEFEIHDVMVEGEEVVEVWTYHKDYDEKIHAFSVLKKGLENPVKLYKHIEDNMDEFIEAYKEEVF